MRDQPHVMPPALWVGIYTYVSARFINSTTYSKPIVSMA